MSLHLFSDNQRLSAAQISEAQRICRESLQIVADRPAYIERNRIDPRFAWPDGIWSYDSSNEFASVYRRVAAGHATDLDCLRGFTGLFSEYHLFFAARPDPDLSVAAWQLSNEFEAEMRDRLLQANPPFVDEWQIMTRGMPRQFIFSPPAMLGEVGHVMHGVIINHDTCAYQERINLIYRSGLADWVRARIEATGEIRICEIGGGYGALCYWFKQAFPDATYTIIDLPESLLFSQLYLSLTRPDLDPSLGLEQRKFGVRFVPNHMAEMLTESFDLVINTLPMSEMSEFQVNTYVDLMMTTWLSDGGLFFEQNQDNQHLGHLSAQEVFKLRFPYRWQLHDGTKVFWKGYPNIWSTRPIALAGAAASTGTAGSRASVGAASPVTNAAQPQFIASIGRQNIIRFAGQFYTVPQSLGEVELTEAAERGRPEIQIWPNLAAAEQAAIAQSEREAVAARAEAETAAPRFIASIGRQNIIHFRRQFYTIPHSLGELDVAEAVQRGVQEILAWSNLAAAEAAAHADAAAAQSAEAALAAAAPPHFIKSVAAHNIVRFRECFYAVPQSLGELDLAEALEREMPQIRAWPSIAAAEAAAEDAAMAQAAAESAAITQPHLVGSVGSHNIVRLGDRFYSVPQSLGDLDLADAVEKGMPEITEWPTFAAAEHAARTAEDAT